MFDVALQPFDFVGREVHQAMDTSVEFQQIHLDFAGVRNIGSSFCNAMLANLISQHGPSVLRKVRFANGRPNVRVMIESTLKFGNAARRRA